MFLPSGDISGHSWALPGGFSRANPPPHDPGGEHKMTNGDTSVLITGDRITLTAATIVLSGEVHLGGEGGALVHRRGDSDSDGDIAEDSATKVYAV